MSNLWKQFRTSDPFEEDRWIIQNLLSEWDGLHFQRNDISIHFISHGMYAATTGVQISMVSSYPKDSCELYLRPIVCINSQTKAQLASIKCLHSW
ncbi:hypothetical protein TNCT_603521 [Trichonephila clavata]|uniref:Uncharacterized protein n=1 Tax=Trichonephila clavata TaxID=2740835 RepID=A0A8X6FTY6_TRICU|nr:hypothetical protein TNCT_603521 [Trichonephila clavata]